jgi:predicted outer membrane protein
MKQLLTVAPLLAVALAGVPACDSKKDPVATGREAVKDVVTQPFNTLDAAKESLQQSEGRSEAAIAEMEKEFKQP